MNTIDMEPKRAKKQRSNVDWGAVAAHTRNLVLQGLVTGIASAVGAKLVTGALSPAGRPVPLTGGGNVIRMPKSGTA